jgi:6-phosphogluconolactonase
VKNIVPLGVCAVLVCSLGFAGCGSSSSGDTVSKTTGSAATGAVGFTAEYLYAVDNPGGASSVEVFQIDLKTGGLTPSGSVAAGNNANDVVVDSQSKFLFVGNSPGCCAATHPPAQVTPFVIGGSGNLSPVQSIALPNTDDTLQSLAVDPSGASLYVSSTAAFTSGTITSFVVDRSSGTMSAPSDVPSMAMPAKIAVHSSGKFAYAAVNSGGIDLLTRNGSGALADTKRVFPAGSGDLYTDMSFAQGGTFLVAVSQNSRKMTVFSVNGTTGDLSVVTQTPDDFLQVATSGKWVFTTHTNNSVETHMMYNDGTLLQIGYSSTPAQVRNVVVDPGGKFVYAQSANSAQIFGFSLDDSTGKLTPIPGSPFATGAITSKLAVAAR